MELQTNSADGVLYIKHWQSWYKVIAIVKKGRYANNICLDDPEASVLAVYGKYIIVVSKEDLGRKKI